MLFRIWKQITTPPLSFHPSASLYLSICCSEFESKSQRLLARDIERFGCIYRYVVPNLKANHNCSRCTGRGANVVSIDMLFRIWKQITTASELFRRQARLYLSICCSEFESKSQLLRNCDKQPMGCIYRYVVPNLKANHNVTWICPCWRFVVSIDMLFRIWKQITTTPWAINSYNKLYLSICCSEFESNKSKNINLSAHYLTPSVQGGFVGADEVADRLTTLQI